MRLFLAILFTVLLAGITTWLFPWWMVAVSAFVVMLIVAVKPSGGFLAGFLGIALLWLAVVVVKDMSNAHVLSGRMAKLFGLPNATLFIVVTVILGGLIGGLAGWSGALTRKIFSR